MVDNPSPPPATEPSDAAREQDNALMIALSILTIKRVNDEITVDEWRKSSLVFIENRRLVAIQRAEREAYEHAANYLELRGLEEYSDEIRKLMES